MERTCGDVLFLRLQDGRPVDHVPAFAGITPAGQVDFCAGADRCPSVQPFAYQDDLETPGISPRSARPRKHSLQRPNLRR